MSPTEKVGKPDYSYAHSLQFSQMITNLCGFHMRTEWFKLSTNRSSTGRGSETAIGNLQAIKSVGWISGVTWKLWEWTVIYENEY